MFSRSDDYPLDSQEVVRALLERIVHSSIMRLGPDSLEKLFELIFMAVKYQMFTAPEPQSLFDITMAHVESWSLMTEGDPEILLQVQHAQSLLVQHYKNASPWTWMDIRQSLLNYLLPNKTRVTIFLKRGYQDQTTAHFRLDLQRDLPVSIGSRPSIRPYVECSSTQSLPSIWRVARLGSNMFNDKPPSRNRNGCNSGIKTLDRTLLGNNNSNNRPPSPDSEVLADSGVCGVVRREEETIQLHWAPAPAAITEPIATQEETLLDLFDQALNFRQDEKACE